MATRRSLDDTKELILGAGLDLLAQSDYQFHIEAVSLIDACRHAGLGTAGSGYKIWPTQEEFRIDLLRYAVSERDALDERIKRLSAMAADPTPIADFREEIRVGALHNAKEMLESPELIRHTAMWLAASRDEELREAYRNNQDAYIRALTKAYATVMEREGRIMRPPLSVEMLATAVEAQTFGLAQVLLFGDTFDVDAIERVARSDSGDDAETQQAAQQWNLLGCVIEAIVDAFTVLADDVD